MKYIRAIISSDTQKVLYQKDFLAPKIFEKVVSVFAGILINADFMQKTDLYAAHVIPHYGQYRRAASSSTSVRTIGLERQSITSVMIEEPIEPERPISYFTIDMLTFKEHTTSNDIDIRMYRMNFPLTYLEYFWKGIENSLIRDGILEQNTHRHRRLFIRDDNQADLEGEEVIPVYDEADAAALVEIIPSEIEDLVDVIPQRSFTDLRIQQVKTVVRGKLVDVTPLPQEEEAESEIGLRIIIQSQVLEDLQRIARSHVKVEQGGVLVGLVYKDDSLNSYLVEIEGYIPAEGAVANEVELRYTFESWQNQTTLLKEHFPGKRIVGWYHTHLDIVKKTFAVAAPQKGIYTTPLFFSKDDLFTHRQFFRAKWYVAMVLDPEGNLTFFQWNGDDIGESSHFYMVNSEKKE